MKQISVITNEEINQRAKIAIKDIIKNIREELAKYEPEYSYKNFEPDKEAIRKHLMKFLAAEFPN